MFQRVSHSSTLRLPTLGRSIASRIDSIQVRTLPQTRSFTTQSKFHLRNSHHNNSQQQQIYRQQQRTVFSSKERKEYESKIPDPYYGKYTPRTDPIPDGFWTQNPYGKPYFVGNTPHIENLMKQGRQMGLYDGREHPYNPSRMKDAWDDWSFGIPGKYFGYAFFAAWVYLYWKIQGRTLKDNGVNSFWRFVYLHQLETYWPLPLLSPPSPSRLLPPVTEQDIIDYHTPKSKVDSVVADKTDSETKTETESSD